MIKQMKSHKYLIVAAAIALAGLGQAQASVIDLGTRLLRLGSGGPEVGAAYIEMDQGLDPGTLVYLNRFESNKDGFTNDGAVDGSHFGTTLTDGDANATISWDLSTTGFQLSYVFIKDGRTGNGGPVLYHLYGITPDEVFNSMGNQYVTIDGTKQISYLVFFGVPGSPTVPEGGSTLILLGSALGLLELGRRRFLS